MRSDSGITADDFGLSHSAASAAFYTDVGFATCGTGGSGHCGFESGWEGLHGFEEGMDHVDR